MKIQTIARSRVRAANKSGRTLRTGRIGRDEVVFTIRPETFGERLRRLRLDAGLYTTQLGVAGSAVSRLENGWTDPTIATLVTIADRLGTTLDYLFLGRGEP